MKRCVAATILFTMYVVGAAAQPVFTDVFPPDEYAARRAKVFAAIGDGVAIVQAATERAGEQAFRQANQFNYLCGVGEPRAILLLDGKTKKAILYLQLLVQRDLESKYGPGMITPAPDVASRIGVDEAKSREEFAKDLQGYGRRILWTPFRMEVLSEGSASDVVLLNRLNLADPWDGRLSRESVFRDKLAAALGTSEVKDLDPVLDGLRSVKSPREIALIKEATAITADGILRGIKATRPGMKEYQIQAETEYVFKQRGSYGTSYFALVATGKNTWYTHYHRNTAEVMAGDIVQLDDAPDYKGYTSDLSRVFPASGRWTPKERERYTIYLALYRAVLSSIEVHKTPQQVVEAALPKMDKVIANHPAMDDATRKAVQNFIDGYRTRIKNGNIASLGHSVGMEVHDVGASSLHPTLEPGMVFTIEPAIRFEDDHTGMRIEDMVVITENGVDILSRDLPEDPDAIEKLMRR